MKIQTKSFFWSCLSVVGLACASVSAQPSGSAFLKVDPSPRSYALGGADMVASVGAEALSANPANLAAMQSRYEMFNAVANPVSDASYWHTALALNRGLVRNRLLSAFGLYVTHMGVGDIQGRDAAGNPTASSFSSQDTAFGLGLAVSPWSALQLGVSGKVIQSEIAGYRSEASLAADIGMRYRFSALSRRMTLGAAVRNLGQGRRYLNQTDPLPTSASAGLGMEVGPARVLAEADQLVNDAKTEIRFGAEFHFGALALRAGYRSLGTAPQPGDGSVQSILGNLTTGLGFSWKAMRLDYALEQDSSGLGMSHKAALTLQWGRK